MTTVGVSMPMLNQPYSKYPEMAALAEGGGFDSLWNYEFYRNPFVTHGLSAVTTERIKLGTGIAAMAGRTPFEMANAAADVDELSGGRVLLGLGVGGEEWQDRFHGTGVDRPAARMREYVEVLQLAWQHLRTGEPASYEGQFYRFASPAANPWGLRDLERERIPVYLGALRPKTLALAGEIADGVLGFMYTPEFIEERVRPHIIEGVRRAGRDFGEIDLTAYVVCSVAEDRAVALRRARLQVGVYVLFPASAPVAEFMGLEEDRDAVLRAFAKDGPAGLERATSDALVRAFSIAGTPDECRERLQEYDGALSHVILHAPYTPFLTGEESEDAFRAIVSTFAPARA
ncbi:LLM class flavin-dependent oxidoreductase [Amycolatopsis sp. NPDC051371]|uniref:LLM class flavin-dependent oxidoreductase n=1 Tax=Amycolatopsis sp. NPDC051371 TaxID=3155800 RepID=UPI003414E8B5